jgi:hypothetical protein
MREDKRGPAERGSILVEEGDSATDTARARTDAPASADQPDQASAPPEQADAGQADQADAGQADQAIAGQPGTGSATGPETGSVPAADPGGPRLGEPGPLSPEPPASPAGGKRAPGDQPTGPNPVVHPTGPNPVVRTVPAGDADEPDVVEVTRPDDEPGRAATAEPADQPGRSATGEPGDAVETARTAQPVPARSEPSSVVRHWEPAAPEPSWGTVLATTISLWASRRFGRLTGRSRRAGTVAVYGAADTPSPRRGIRWPLVVFVLILVILALVGLQLSGALSGNQPSRPAAKSGGAANGPGSLSAAEAARDHAASWMAQQVTSSDLIACDPLMCSTLQSDGVAASQLMPMQSTSTDPLGADVVAATSSIRGQFGSQLVSEYAPELIASFGSGASRVDVRAVANDGAAAFEAKEQADLAARKSAGAQLLGNGFQIPAPGAGQLRAGQVDSRLLVTLAALLSQRQVQVSSFGDTGPGGPVLYRQVTIVNASGQTGTSALAADLSQVRAQRNSYLPAHATIVRLAKGQSALRIEFGAPDQPGLLSGGNS